MKLKTISNHPVWSGVIGTGICSFIGTVTGLIDWNEVWIVARTGLYFLGDTSGVANWLIGVVGLYIAYTFAVFIRNFGEKVSEEGWLTYRKDKFFQVQWRWRYFDHQPSNLNPFCPSCDLQLDLMHDSMFNGIDSISLHCDCGAGPWRYEQSWDKLKHDVTKKIQQKIRAGTWQADRANT